jgi:hypothetical protein
VELAQVLDLEPLFPAGPTGYLPRAAAAGVAR